MQKHPAQLTQRVHELNVQTEGPGFYEITGLVTAWTTHVQAAQGLLTLFVQHTSASLTIQENADPDVQRDLLTALERLAPRGGHYRHSSEGADDMPAHIKAMLTSVHLSVPVIDGRAALGTWQGLYLIEHRDQTRERRIALHFIGAVND